MQIKSFQSEYMKRHNQPEQYGLFEKLASCSGPTETIFGGMVDAPPTALWGIVKGTKLCDTLSDAISQWPEAEIETGLILQYAESRISPEDDTGLNCERPGSVIGRILARGKQ